MKSLQSTFTLHYSPFTRLYPLPLFSDQWLMVNGKSMANGEWKMVNASKGDF